MVDETESLNESAGGLPDAPRGRKRRRIALVSAGALAALAIGLWSAREQIAGGLIDRQLAQLNLHGRYTIEGIGADRQVLRDIVIGDPAIPISPSPAPKCAWPMALPVRALARSFSSSQGFMAHTAKAI